MNSEFESKETQDPNSRPESFSKPRTIPSNWDVSAFTSQITSGDGTSREQQNTAEGSEGMASEQSPADWNPDPFPEPRTIPGKWDTSNLE